MTTKSKMPRKLKKIKNKLLLVASPCDGAPTWAKAPSPSSNPLDTMEWATGTKKDKFGCTRTDADGSKKFHAGIDIKAAIGTDCFATEDATVTDVGSGLDLGNWVAISFIKGGKKYGVAYCHLSKQSVKNGDKLKKGDKVGETGISGNAEINNPHLHLEVQDQVWVAYSSASDRSKHGLDNNDYINAIS
jgi:murein DD-endopeptidase MepM/ murein hydrolase activator NlpD